MWKGDFVWPAINKENSYATSYTYAPSLLCKQISILQLSKRMSQAEHERHTRDKLRSRSTDLVNV